MKKFIRKLFTVILLAALVFPGLRFGPSLYARIFGGGNVQSGVKIQLLGDRMGAVSKGRCDFPRDRRGQWIIDHYRRKQRVIRRLQAVGHCRFALLYAGKRTDE